MIARTSKGKNLATLKPSNLRDDVSGGAETINPDASRITGFYQRTIANQSRAKQRSCLDIGVVFWDRKTEAFVGHHVFSITAVQSVAGELGAIAKIFSARTAVWTFTT